MKGLLVEGAVFALAFREGMQRLLVDSVCGGF